MYLLYNFQFFLSSCSLIEVFFCYSYTKLGEYRKVCQISLHISQSEPKCKIYFADDTDTDVTNLFIAGEFAAFPDAIHKFDKLTTLQVGSAQLETVDRSKLAAFKRIKDLSIRGNLITELAADTFNDLKELSLLSFSENKLTTIHRDVFQELLNLETLYLWNTQLESLPDGIFRQNQKLDMISLYESNINVLHRDIFKGLHNLQYINLNRNQLEVLPDGLFRENRKLKNIWLSENKIRKIECNFYNLPNLVSVDLSKNVCIDELCEVKSFCGTTSMSAMHTKIWTKCPNGNQV